MPWVISAGIDDFGFTEATDAAAQALSSSGNFSPQTSTPTLSSMSAPPSPPPPSGAAATLTPPSRPLWKPASLRHRCRGLGSVNWTYSVTDAFDFLDAGETITLTYTVTITDNNNATDTDTVQVTITGTNDAPVISAGIDDFGFTEATDAAAQALSSSGTLSFTDIDTNAVIDVSSAVTTAAVWSGGDIDAALKAGSGSRFLQPGTDVEAWIRQLDLLRHRCLRLPRCRRNHHADLHGHHHRQQQRHRYRHRALMTSGLSLITSSTNDIDTNAVIDVSSAVTTAAVWSGGDIDADLKAALEAGFSISGTDVEAPGSVNWTYSVTDAFDFLDAGETITLTYTVTITDNNNAADKTDTVQVMITGTNDAPVISAGIDDFGFNGSHRCCGAGSSAAAATLSFTDIDTNAVIDVSSAVTTAASLERGGDIDCRPQGRRSRLLHLRHRCRGSGIRQSTYSVTDAFDFLDAGETITLTYTSPSPTTTTPQIQTPFKSRSPAPTMPR